jgi:hypothetical protein
MRRRDTKRFCAERIAEVHAKCPTAYGKMKDLPQGCVGQVLRGERILRFWNLLRRTPTCHPVRLLGYMLRLRPGCYTAQKD